jgi:multicomponent Na+:H+ antiporter subunit E
MTARIPAPAARWAGFFCLWLVLFGIDATTLLAGAATAVVAAWTSVRLLPPGAVRLRTGALATLVLRFFWQSAVAGADVARRALDPSLPLRPGLVRCPTRLGTGLACDAFCSLSSLLPGSLPVGSDRGALLVHCLDVGQDLPARMAAEEAMFLAALGRAVDDG